VLYLQKEGTTVKRMTLFVFSIVALLLSSAAFCAGEVRQYQIQSRILLHGRETAQRTLSVYLPEGYDTSGASYPVLYLIHGHGGNNTTFLGGHYEHMSEANVGVIVDMLIQEQKIKPLIVVCPDVDRIWWTSLEEKETGVGIDPYNEYLLHDVASFVDRKLRTLADRGSRAIAGHSQVGTTRCIWRLRTLNYSVLSEAFLHTVCKILLRSWTSSQRLTTRTLIQFSFGFLREQRMNTA
jgi:hypothetical protein